MIDADNPHGIPTHTEPTPADHHARIDAQPTLPSGSAMTDIPTPNAPKAKLDIVTTIAGILTALGLIGEQLATSGAPQDVASWLGLGVKAFAPVILGYLGFKTPKPA